MASTGEPDLTIEIDLGNQFGWPVFSVDEVGRGSVAGPVHVGVAALYESSCNVRPPRVKDSKALSKAQRERLYEEASSWGCVVVGHATASEVDAIGITAALRLACERALSTHVGMGRVPRVILLDGSFDWLTRASIAPEALRAGLVPWVAVQSRVPVVTQVKADNKCTGVAAASVVAKVVRDRAMASLSETFPGYGFDRNAGYATSAHSSAIRKLGLTSEHRRTFCKSFMSAKTPNGEEVQV